MITHRERRQRKTEKEKERQRHTQRERITSRENEKSVKPASGLIESLCDEIGGKVFLELLIVLKRIMCLRERMRLRCQR